MVSILISITQHEQYFFLFQAQFATVCLFLLHVTSCSSLMSHYRANNQCDRVKGWHWRWLIYTPHIFYYVITCYMFSEATTSVLESFTNSTGKHLHWSLFFKKLQACRLRVFQIAVMGRGGNFFTGWREPEEDWFWQFKPFSKLKTAFCKYWTLIKIKINMTCVSKECQIKKKWSRSYAYS